MENANGHRLQSRNSDSRLECRLILELSVGLSFERQASQTAIGSCWVSQLNLFADRTPEAGYLAPGLLYGFFDGLDGVEELATGHAVARPYARGTML